MKLTMNVCAIIYLHLQATFERLHNHSLEEFSKVMSSAINAFKIARAFTCLITIKADVTEKNYLFGCTKFHCNANL